MIWVAVVLLWAAAGHRLRAARHQADMINCSYAGAVGALAAAATVRALKTDVDSVTGPYVGDLVEHLLVVVSGLSAQLFLLGLRTGKVAGAALRLRIVVAAGVAGAMVASFAAAPIHHAVTGDLDQVYGHLPAVVAYRVVFNAQLAYVLVDNLRLCSRYVGLAGNRDRTVSLLITGYSSAVALVYPVSRVLYDLIELAGLDAPTLLRTIGTATALLGVGGMAVGTLAPRVVPALRGWAEARRGTQRLRPLWSDLTAAFPQVRLSTGFPVSPRRAELRYDRYLVEVDEGLALARVPAPYATAPRPTGLDSDAALLHGSRRAWTDPAGVPVRRLLPGRNDHREDNEQLLALADAYAAVDLDHRHLDASRRPS
jgi:hypothetical protein